MPKPTWQERLGLFVSRLRHGKADPNSPEHQARLRAEEELDSTLRARRDQHRQRGNDGLNGGFGSF
ncbi:MAG: hypothetical protein REI45_11805 [Propionicimonas sp.]|nr:hypothetical protein [Propionicimonas sp.]